MSFLRAGDKTNIQNTHYCCRYCPSHAPSATIPAAATSTSGFTPCREIRAVGPLHGAKSAGAEIGGGMRGFACVSFFLASIFTHFFFFLYSMAWMACFFSFEHKFFFFCYERRASHK